MGKKKTDIAEVLNDCVDIFSMLSKAMELLSTVAKQSVPVVEKIRDIYGVEPVVTALPDDTPTKAKVIEEKKAYTKTDVRQCLSGLAESHREDVKALLNKYGASNLTQLDESHYADIMADAEELKDA